MLLLFLCFIQGFYHFLGFFHIGYDVFDVVGRTVFAVPVIAYPQVGFIVGVEAFVEISNSHRNLSKSPSFISTETLKSCPLGVYC